MDKKYFNQNIKEGSYRIECNECGSNVELFSYNYGDGYICKECIDKFDEQFNNQEEE